ncbi:phosphosulfolactate synthase [Tumebacillus permanentifrigoris]|uniref:Phosphosulfolactate synthase n=1 Tax=Tumebacillus permanentifrigoris TaxID=378543 RepID=A0A316DBG8_9BACL|nr:phosphosulfolactate synthase [Tumebacillus permanentifrigoris]PWK14330.1 phosphosulfolactate synthase [Tumebacillus permanentifrigoris]
MQRKALERAWDDILRDPLPGRLAKPRSDHGLTMLIDTGLGVQETADLVRLAGAYIDFIKLGFGTSKLYPTDVLQEKIALLHSAGIDVYPGGTFLEAAVLQDKWREFLLRCQQLGLRTVEVSDGTIQLSAELRREIITTARELGFNVITEVGKKENDSHLPVSTQLQMIATDLEAGAYKVIIEGRESGKGVGLFDGNGQILRDEFDELVKSVGNPKQLIWEAPLRSQQEELIHLFGPNVNFGNIKPHDIISLEALRCGLRSDTLRYTL